MAFTSEAEEFDESGCEHDSHDHRDLAALPVVSNDLERKAVRLLGAHSPRLSVGTARDAPPPGRQALDVAGTEADAAVAVEQSGVQLLGCSEFYH